MMCKLSDICEFGKGKTDVSSLTLKNYISTENMLPNKGGITLSANLPTVPQTQEYVKGDILVSNIRPYFKKIWKATTNGGCSNDVLVFRAKKDTDPDFLYYVLADDSFFNYSMATSKGTKMPRGDKTAIMQYQVPAFELPIQHRIASILRSIDDKIEINNQINDNLEQQAASLYYSMFVSYDYYPSIEFEESDLGLIPKGWKVLTLGDVTTNIRDRVHNNSYRVLSALNSGILQPSDEYFTKQVFSKDIGNYIVVAENDFAYNPARVNIGSLGINDLGYIGCVSPVYVVFRTEDKYQDFMRFFVKSKRFQEEVKTRASGSVRQAMNYTDFSLIRLSYPPQKAAHEFNAAVDPIWKTIKHLQQENDKLSELRDYLLPRLMSGKIDVSEVEI